MPTIRIVSGTGSGPTAIAAYDAALAGANVHNYNLVTISSVIPPETTVEDAGTAPDLGPIGGELRVVQARAASADARVSAALAWGQDESGRGLVYEAAGERPQGAIRERARTGLEAGRELREWTFATSDESVASAAPEGDEYAGTAVLAVYGGSRSVW